MANTALAKEILSLLKLHPEKHDQQNWVKDRYLDDNEEAGTECGTTACIAGWATILHYGLKPKTRPAHDGGRRVYYEVPEDLADWECAGAEALGLSFDLGSWLFYLMPEDAAIRALEDVAAGVTEDEMEYKFIRNMYDGPTDPLEIADRADGAIYG